MSWGMKLLPAIVGKCLVGFSHLVYVLALLHRSTAIRENIHDLSRKPFFNGLFRSKTRKLNQPAGRKRLTPRRFDFDRNLISRTTDSPRLHFQYGPQVLKRLLENFEWIFVCLVLDNVKARVERFF